MNKQCEKLFNAAMQFRKLHLKGTLFNISHSEYCTLKTINICAKECKKKNEQVKVSMLSERMHMNNTAVSRSLKALESQELIERNVSTKDRRVTYVSLTDKGQKLIHKIEKAVEKYQEAVFSQIDTQQVDMIVDFLNELYEISRKELEKRKDEKNI